MDRFIGMEVFVKVVEAASFASTARHFRLSPAMVSKHVRMLEERLGARLLNRTTRRVSATEAGQRYYERCLRILADVAEADRLAADLHTSARGVLKVSAPVTFGIGRLASSVAEYLSTHPGVSVDLTLNDHDADLLEDGFDLAIRVGDLPDSSLIARRLTLARMVVCAAPSYIERDGEPQTPAELTDHNCLDHTYSPTANAWTFFAPDGRKEVVSIGGRFRANNGDALRTLVLQGDGIMLAPSFIIHEDLQAGRLVPMLTAYEAAKMPIHAVYPHSRLVSTKVRTFVDFLAAQFGQKPGSDRGANVAVIGRRNAKHVLHVVA